MTITIGTLLAAHAAGKPLATTIEETYARIEKHDDFALFIAIRPKSEALAIAERMQTSGPEGKPLYGVPFVVKDNIDVAGLPTTAACPAFAYQPGKSAFAVEKLERAGAIVIGKTNLDQFATGLVGVRSPYGIPRNALRADLIPGGSSSGSATAVGAGLVPFSLGTDTAGSGRVPAAFNGIVGLKPSLGALSTSGVVPACRTLDTISIFARDVADAFMVYQAACAFDKGDAYSRPFPHPRFRPSRAGSGSAFPARINASSSTTQSRSGFFARHSARRIAWRANRRVRLRAIRRGRPRALRRSMGRRAIRRDQAADREQSGSPASRHPLDHRGRAQVRRCLRVRGVLPARRSEAEDEPRLVRIRRDGCSDHAAPLHARRGRGRSCSPQFQARDLHQLRQPARPLRDRRSPGRSRRRAAVERDADRARRRRRSDRWRGRRTPPFRCASPSTTGSSRAPSDRIEIAVVGAHLSGLPLNRELVELGASFSREVETTADYRLFALPGSSPPKPGLLRIGENAGAAIKAEVWTLDPAGFGAFVAKIPAPLGIGTIQFNDGGSVKGFLVEAEAVKAAEDVSHFGGWRAYLKSR